MHVHNGVIIVMEKLIASSPTILERKKTFFNGDNFYFALLV